MAAVQSVIKPGDKIELRLLKDVQESEHTGEQAKAYVSHVYDVNERGNLEIAMPTNQGKLVVLPLSVRIEFVFYSNSAMYKSVGQIVERFKRDNAYILEVELKSRLAKVQRREFFRHECTIQFDFCELTEKQAQLGDSNLILKELQQDKQFKDKLHSGVILDISGGGMRFYSSKEVQPEGYIFAFIHLYNEAMNSKFCIVSSIISSTQKQNARGTAYDTRAKFLLKDSKIQEEIVQYVFEEERLARRKGIR